LTAAEFISKDNYVKIDSTVMVILKERFPKIKVEAASANIHYIVLKYIQSEQMFYLKNLEQVESGYYIYSFGSVHNMYGIVSILLQLMVVSCSGVGEWEIAAEKLTPKDVTTFWKAVTDYNLGRLVFFFAGKYYFNLMLNVIR
jgi:hypothetical protein